MCVLSRLERLKKFNSLHNNWPNVHLPPPPLLLPILCLQTFTSRASEHTNERKIRKSYSGVGAKCTKHTLRVATVAPALLKWFCGFSASALGGHTRLSASTQKARKRADKRQQPQRSTPHHLVPVECCVGCQTKHSIAPLANCTLPRLQCGTTHKQAGYHFELANVSSIPFFC